MSKTSRLEVRLDVDLRARVAAEADHRGQSLTVFVERALESALAGSLKSEAAPPSGPQRASTRTPVGKGTFTPVPKGKT